MDKASCQVEGSGSSGQSRKSFKQPLAPTAYLSWRGMLTQIPQKLPKRENSKQTRIKITLFFFLFFKYTCLRLIDIICMRLYSEVVEGSVYRNWIAPLSTFPYGRSIRFHDHCQVRRLISQHVSPVQSRECYRTVESRFVSHWNSHFHIHESV